MLGDIASADAKPPENVLFVCKLNPMTEDEVSELVNVCVNVCVLG